MAATTDIKKQVVDMLDEMQPDLRECWILLYRNKLYNEATLLANGARILVILQNVLGTQVEIERREEKRKNGPKIVY